MPTSSIARADATISSSGSIVSCMTPIRNGGGITSILSCKLAVEERTVGERAVGPGRVLRHHAEPRVPKRFVERACGGAGMCRQPQERDRARPCRLLDGVHQPCTDPGAARTRCDSDAADLRAMS